MRYEIVDIDLSALAVDPPEPRRKLAWTVAGVTALAIVLFEVFFFPPAFGDNPPSLDTPGGAAIGTAVTATDTLSSDPLWTNTTTMHPPKSVFQGVQTWASYRSVTGTCSSDLMLVTLPQDVASFGDDRLTTMAYIKSVFKGITAKELAQLKTGSPLPYQSGTSGKFVQALRLKSDVISIDIRAFGNARRVIISDTECNDNTAEAAALMSDAELHSIVHLTKP